MSGSDQGYPHDNLRHVVITATCFAFILSTAAVGFRLVSRKINHNSLFLDDYLIIGALVHHGFGVVFELEN